jgi:hypothetical protein
MATANGKLTMELKVSPELIEAIERLEKATEWLCQVGPLPAPAVEPEQTEITYTIECPQCRFHGYVTSINGKAQKTFCHNCGHELRLFNFPVSESEQTREQKAVELARDMAEYADCHYPPPIGKFIQRAAALFGEGKEGERGHN